MSTEEYPLQGHVAEYVIFADLGLFGYAACASAAAKQRMRGTGIVQGTVLYKGREVQWKLREAHEVGGARLPDRSLDRLPVEPVIEDPDPPLQDYAPRRPAPKARRPSKSRHLVNPAIRQADLEKLARRKNLSENSRQFMADRAGLRYRPEPPPMSVQLARLKGASVGGLNRALKAYGLRLVEKGKAKKQPPAPPRFLPTSAYAWRPKLPSLAEQVGTLRAGARSMLNRGLAPYGLKLENLVDEKRKPAKAATTKKPAAAKPAAKKPAAKKPATKKSTPKKR